MAFKDNKEKLTFELHNRLVEITGTNKEFNFKEQADELMQIFQHITEDNYTYIDLVFLSKRVGKLEKANKLQDEINEVLINVDYFIKRKQTVITTKTC